MISFLNHRFLYVNQQKTQKCIRYTFDTLLVKVYQKCIGQSVHFWWKWFQNEANVFWIIHNSQENSRYKFNRFPPPPPPLHPSRIMFLIQRHSVCDSQLHLFNAVVYHTAFIQCACAYMCPCSTRAHTWCLSNLCLQALCSPCALFFLSASQRW